MKQRLLNCAHFLVGVWWLFVRETVEMTLLALGVFYLGASFGRQDVQPHFLGAHEAWAVFLQLMNTLFTKMRGCGQ